MNILLIEDELPAAQHIISLIKQFDDSYKIIGPITSNDKLLRWLESNPHPDLIISDIKLLDGPVFFTLDKIEIHVPMIFTTAYDHYMLDAFKNLGIAYILKPFEFKDIENAFKKLDVLRQKFSQSHFKEMLSDIKLMSEKRYRSILNVKIGKGIYLLKTDEIVCIKTDYGVPNAYKENGKKIPLNFSISELMDVLIPDQFFQINRSEIINIDFISKCVTSSSDRLDIHIDHISEVLTPSASRTPILRDWLNKL